MENEKNKGKNTNTLEPFATLLSFVTTIVSFGALALSSFQPVHLMGLSIFLVGVNISHYEQGNRFNLDPMRTRKLLMHKIEIVKLYSKIKQEGYTLVPTKAYFSDSKVKIEIGLAKGKKNYDKRDSIAEKQAKRDIDRALKNQNKYL